LLFLPLPLATGAAVWRVSAITSPLKTAFTCCARELHDTLAHSLSALTVQLEALRTLLTHDPAAAQDALNGVMILCASS